MAKLRGAMHSDEASGAFGKVMTFRRGKQGAVVTGYYKPGSARKIVISEAQLAQREKYGQAVEAWKALTIEAKTIFNENAKAQIISGWNLFMKNFTPGPPGPTLEWSEQKGQMDWDQATALAISIGGGWRLPTVAELVAKYNETGSLPSGWTDDWYWTNEEIPPENDHARCVQMGTGVPTDMFWKYYPIGSTIFVRAL